MELLINSRQFSPLHDLLIPKLVETQVADLKLYEKYRKAIQENLLKYESFKINLKLPFRDAMFAQKKGIFSFHFLIINTKLPVRSFSSLDSSIEQSSVVMIRILTVTLESELKDGCALKDIYVQ